MERRNSNEWDELDHATLPAFASWEREFGKEYALLEKKQHDL